MINFSKGKTNLKLKSAVIGKLSFCILKLIGTSLVPASMSFFSSRSILTKFDIFKVFLSQFYQSLTYIFHINIHR